MANYAKIGQTVFKNKDEVKKLFDETQDLINKKTQTPKPAELLEKTKKQKVQVGDKEEIVAGNKETVTEISKKDFKVKKPKEMSAEETEDLLWTIKNKRVTPAILSDFNINNIKSKEDIHSLIELVSKKYKGDINKQTRGVQTNDATKKLADLIQADPDNLTKTLLSLKKGDTLSAEYILAARELMAAGMVKLDDLALKANSPMPDTKDILAFRQHFALMSEFQKIVKGVQTETARALQQFRIPTRTKTYSHVDIDDLNKNELLVSLGGTDEIKNMAKLYLSTGTKKAKMEFTQGAGALHNLRAFSDSIAEIFINSILSNPMTHIRNTGGNWVAQAITKFEHKMVAKLHGGKVKGGVAEFEDIAAAYGRTMANQEMLAALSTMMKGKNFGQKLKKVLTEFDDLVPATHGVTGSKIELVGQKATASKFNLKEGTAANSVDIIGRILTLDRIPTRMLAVADNYFKNGAYREELYTQAFRETMEMVTSGKLPKEKAKYYLASRIVNPTGAMVKSAKEQTLYKVFQTPLKDRGDFLGDIGSIAQKAKGSGGYFSWLSNYYIPFTQTPVNIAGFVAERTPVMAKLLTGYRAKIEAGGAEAQMAKMKLQLGTMFYYAVGGAGYYTHQYGIGDTKVEIAGADIELTGLGNATGGKAEMMKGFNQTPNQIRIEYDEGKFFNLSLNGLDPVATMFAQAGNLAQYTELMLHNTGVDKAMNSLLNEDGSVQDAYKKLDKSQMAYITMAMALSFGENLTNSTFLKGSSDLVRDVQNISKIASGDKNPTTALKQWSQKYVKAFIPSGFKQVSKLSALLPDDSPLEFNDSYRKISTEWNNLVKSQLNNTDLYNDINIFGKPIKPFAFANMTELGPAEKEVLRVLPKLSRTNTSLSRSYGSLGAFKVNFPMKDKEQAYYKTVAGQNFTNGVLELMEDETYKTSDITVQKGLISKLLTASRSDAMSQLKSEDGEFAEDIESRAFDLMIDKYTKTNDGDPITQPEVLEAQEIKSQEKQIN